ncbi:hypothetical protein F383_28473 [Gossypium arboreum]|uniref:Uncharacterized protein n=1 Tax=Gossypium arboreum TaxID=29729 RepID=A0A0B0PA41_GOSAR|nr:hypothetical protein F383_28473 [Gossypium arboreum]
MLSYFQFLLLLFKKN